MIGPQGDLRTNVLYIGSNILNKDLSTPSPVSFASFGNMRTNVLYSECSILNFLLLSQYLSLPFLFLYLFRLSRHEWATRRNAIERFIYRKDIKHRRSYVRKFSIYNIQNFLLLSIYPLPLFYSFIYIVTNGCNMQNTTIGLALFWMVLKEIHILHSPIYS